MSAIYGYSVFGKTDEKYAAALKKQNIRYGGSADGYEILKEENISCSGDNSEAAKSLRSTAIGSCIKQLSVPYNNIPSVITFGKYKAVFDAVLFNRTELQTHLNEYSDYVQSYSKGFSEMTDGELLFFYTMKFGFDSLLEVNGDFTGAIYDTEEKKWTVIRDHNGIRPLFYYLDSEKFIFSTDIRGIIAFPEIRLTINETNLYDLMMGYNELTLCETDYTQIHCIRPASWNIIDKKLGKEEHIYWMPGGKKISSSDPEYYEKELRNLVTDSIRRRLDAVSGVVGCELSGGLDSSVIAIIINRLGRECRYFSWSESPCDHPLQDGQDERKVINDICEQEGITCFYAKKRNQKEHKTISQILEKPDVPYVNTAFLSEGSEKVNNEGAKVMFTGHGGDEGVSHRCNFYELWYNKERLAFFKAIWHSTEVKDKRLLRFVYRVFNQFFKVHPHFKGEYRNGSNLEYFLKDSFKEKMKNTEHLPLTFAYDPAAYILQGGQRVRIDNAAVQGAENGVQYMFPYLDYRVLDFVLSIPRYCFQNGFTNRAVFRSAFYDIMPQSLRDVHYKDEASYRNYVPTEEEIKTAAENITQAKKDIVSYLDENYWGKYLDFGKLRQISYRTEYKEEAISRAAKIMDGLMRCARLQNLYEKLAVNAADPDTE